MFKCDNDTCVFESKTLRGIKIHETKFHKRRPHGKLCACGCGKETLIKSHNFISGHWEATQKRSQHGTGMCYRYGCRCILCADNRLNYGRDKSLRRRYGFSIQDLLEKMKAQNNLCAICQQQLAPYGMQAGRERGGGGETHVDHNHLTGEFRGILCRSCNQGLGKFKDNPEFLERAALYVKNCGMVVFGEKPKGETNGVQT